jgi:hypothetical protein
MATTRLSSLILAHWTRCQPTMLRQLTQENRLETALKETEQQFSDLLYELISVQKMEHHRAWEIAAEQFLLPEESSSTLTQSPSPPATSE